MEDEYMIFESKLNTHTFEELEKKQSNPVDIILRKTLSIAKNPHTLAVQALNDIADVLLAYEIDNVLEVKNKPYLNLNSKDGRWQAAYRHRGKTIYLASSKDKAVVETAINKFCKEYGIEI